jgi:hypothetical protein
MPSLDAGVNINIFDLDFKANLLAIVGWQNYDLSQYGHNKMPECATILVQAKS